MPPRQARPEPLALEPGAAPGLDAVAEHLALAGYERVDRVQERGHFAVRGGLVDVFPTTGRDPVRIELFGDEIEAIRAFSPFTQRALHDVESAVVYPAAERRLDLQEPRLTEDGETAPVPGDLVPPLDRAPDLVWEPEQVREVWAEEFQTKISLKGAAELDPFPRGQEFAFEAQRPAVAARGLAEAETELAGFISAGNRVIVAFPHRGEALRTANLLRRVEPRLLEPGEPLPDGPELLFAVSPARRGFVWRDLGLVLLPDTQVFRKRPPRTDHRLGRALQSFADLRTGDFVVHEDHGIGKLLGFETKTVAEVTRDYLFLGFRGDDRLYVPHEQIGKVSKYVGADALRARALQARRQGLAEPEEPRAHGAAGARGRPARPLRAPAAGAGHGLRPLLGMARAARGRVPLPRDRRPAHRDRGGQGGPRGAAADGPAGLRRRRLRQDRGSRSRRLRRRGQRQADADARARRRCWRSSTGTPSASATATSR